MVRDAQSLRALKRWPVGGRGASQYWPTALAPDDRAVAIGGEDGSVRLLDLETGEERAALGRHVAEVFGARFTPDGRRLITTGADSGVILWDVQRATAGETFSGQPGRVLTPQITRDGRTLYTAGPGAAVFIWDLAGTRRLGRPFSTGAPSAQPGLAAVAPGRALPRAQLRRPPDRERSERWRRHHRRRAHAYPTAVVPGRHSRSRARTRLRATQPPPGRDRPGGLPRTRRRRPRTRAQARARSRRETSCPRPSARTGGCSSRAAMTRPSACGPYRT